MTFNIRMTPELHQKIICAANAVNAENLYPLFRFTKGDTSLEMWG